MKIVVETELAMKYAPELLQELEDLMIKSALVKDEHGLRIPSLIYPEHAWIDNLYKPEHNDD